MREPQIEKRVDKMSSLPFAIFRLVQGLSYPKITKLVVAGAWDTRHWEATHSMSSELDSSTDIVIIDNIDENLDRYIKKFKNIDYRFHLVIYSRTSEKLDKYLSLDSRSCIFNTSCGTACVLLNRFGNKSFLSEKIKLNEDIDLEDPLLFLPHFEPEKWSQDYTTVYFEAPEEIVTFTVPETFSLKRTSPDLLWAVEHVILSPWHKKYQEKWVPTRRPGNYSGLSFSGGVDSTAAMSLMPDSSVLFYMERNFESMIDHTNATRFITHLKQSGRKVVISKSNHEKIRTYYDKNYGFSTDYACMAHMILLADHYDLDSAATGMPLENSYFFHGSKVRQFEKSGFWKRYAPMFNFLGLPLYQPVAGCSEVLTNKIVNDSGFKEYAKSCIRSKIPGKSCDKCWKCFRKNIFNNQSWDMSPEISKFLQKRPLKQGIATLYALQLISKRNQSIPSEAKDLSELMDENLEFLTRYWPPSIELLPAKYQKYTQNRLEEFASQMKIDLYHLNPKIEQILRGENI